MKRHVIAAGAALLMAATLTGCGNKVDIDELYSQADDLIADIQEHDPNFCSEKQIKSQDDDNVTITCQGPMVVDQVSVYDSSNKHIAGTAARLAMMADDDEGVYLKDDWFVSTRRSGVAEYLKGLGAQNMKF